jgi:hypothetical protein
VRHHVAGEELLGSRSLVNGEVIQPDHVRKGYGRLREAGW